MAKDAVVNSKTEIQREFDSILMLIELQHVNLITTAKNIKTNVIHMLGRHQHNLNIMSLWFSATDDKKIKQEVLVCTSTTAK